MLTRLVEDTKASHMWNESHYQLLLLHTNRLSVVNIGLIKGAQLIMVLLKLHFKKKINSPTTAYANFQSKRYTFTEHCKQCINEYLYIGIK